MADHAVVADDEVDLSRRKFLTKATIATGAVGAAFAAVPFIASWNPSERDFPFESPVATEYPIEQTEQVLAHPQSHPGVRIVVVP